MSEFDEIGSFLESKGDKYFAKKDYFKNLDYYLKSKKMGNPKSLSKIGDYFYSSSDYPNFLIFYLKSIEAGNIVYITKLDNVYSALYQHISLKDRFRLERYILDFIIDSNKSNPNNLFIIGYS